MLYKDETQIKNLSIIRSVFKPQYKHCTKYAKYAFLLLSSIYVKIFEKILSGGLEVSFSLYEGLKAEHAAFKIPIFLQLSLGLFQEKVPLGVGCTFFWGTI